MESIAIDDDRDYPAHVRKAAVDGTIAVCRDAGGCASTLGAFALVPDVRSMFDGTIILGGSISTRRFLRLSAAEAASLVLCSRLC
ncbi:hypothetical protein [Roseovarius sp. TE539]|uniref:hypothetical protein n=1 Tax=Roseovarius sp. TE539 TaxID=2249812 RepID=UPI0011BEDC77|nr:hypothetical protein [Roseovarius sp. TE539]